MTKAVRLCGLLLALATFVTANGCRHKPAYSDIDANRMSSSRNQNGGGNDKTTPTSGSAELPANGAGQPAGSPAPEQRFAPAFLDGAGGIKDLPNYPGSTRVNIQMGPNQGFNVMALVFQTRDSMDRIAEFYQKAIKDNGWTVADKLIDPEMSEWTLKKGEENTAKVQVKKDPATSKMNISILRAEKLVEISK